MPLVRLMLTIDCDWKKGCIDAELKNAYKKLSLMEPRLLFCIRKLKHVEEAKNKFQIFVLISCSLAILCFIFDNVAMKCSESHCYRIQENNRYAKEEQEHGIKNQLKSTGKKVIASNLHSELTNEKVAQSQSDGFDSTPIKSTTIQEVLALLSVKSKPKSKPVKDSVQSRSHSNPKERSTSLGNQGKKRLSLPSNGYNTRVISDDGEYISHISYVLPTIMPKNGA
ncbi:hypothetical protein Hanom_Chr13g01184641 [Helianthus anomalus]